jgi:hypothetical protein
MRDVLKPCVLGHIALRFVALARQAGRQQTGSRSLLDRKLDLPKGSVDGRARASSDFIVYSWDSLQIFVTIHCVATDGRKLRGDFHSTN